MLQRGAEEPCVAIEPSPESKVCRGRPHIKARIVHRHPELIVAFEQQIRYIVAESRITSGMLHGRGSVNCQLGRFVGCVEFQEITAVEISAGSSLGLGPLRTKLVMMPFSVQMRKLKTTKFISFSPCLVWAESVSTCCGPASCCGRRSDGPLHLPCDPKAASCRHHRLRMTERIAVGDFRLRRPCTGLRPTFAQPRLAKLKY